MAKSDDDLSPQERSAKRDKDWEERLTKKHQGNTSKMDRKSSEEKWSQKDKQKRTDGS